MFSRPLAFVLLALGCVTAAAGGAYVANRHNTEEVAVATAPDPAVPAAAPTGSMGQAQAPVAETEAVVSGAKSEPRRTRKGVEGGGRARPRRDAPARRNTGPETRARRASSKEPEAARAAPMAGGAPVSQPAVEVPAAPVPPPVAAAPVPEPAKPEVQPEAPRPAQFEEVILPSASVIGLQLETSVSSDRARVEDRVEARVSRDVMAAGRVAIPAGARVIGTVIEVDKGGKVKTPAHIGIRFHTLVLADGSEVALRTEPIFRDAESPAASSAKKIGGAAIAGAILGGIMGGGKGAATGGAIGAAGGRRRGHGGRSHGGHHGGRAGHDRQAGRAGHDHGRATRVDLEIWKCGNVGIWNRVDFQITRFPNFQIERLSSASPSRRRLDRRLPRQSGTLSGPLARSPR